MLAPHCADITLQVVAFGKNMSLTCVYDRCSRARRCALSRASPPLFSCTVVYSNFTPLVIILVGKRGVNVGLMHALLPEIRHKLESIRGVVGNA